MQKQFITQLMVGNTYAVVSVDCCFDRYIVCFVSQLLWFFNFTTQTHIYPCELDAVPNIDVDPPAITSTQQFIFSATVSSTSPSLLQVRLHTYTRY